VTENGSGSNRRIHYPWTKEGGQVKLANSARFASAATVCSSFAKRFFRLEIPDIVFTPSSLPIFGPNSYVPIEKNCCFQDHPDGNRRLIRALNNLDGGCKNVGPLISVARRLSLI